MKCQCGNNNAYHLQARWNKKEQKFQEVCDRCSCLDGYAMPDVYFKEPYFDEHLADAKSPHGTWVNSKGQKSEIMRRMGIHEAGDRIHGARG